MPRAADSGWWRQGASTTIPLPSLNAKWSDAGAMRVRQALSQERVGLEGELDAHPDLLPDRRRYQFPSPSPRCLMDSRRAGTSTPWDPAVRSLAYPGSSLRKNL